MAPYSIQFSSLLQLTIISLLSSYWFDFVTNRLYDDLLDMVTHKNQQCMSDQAVFQNSCSMYSILYICIYYI